MSIDIDQGLNLLKQFSCIEGKTINSQEEKKQLQEALKLIADLSDSLNFGICASSEKEAFTTLSHYLKAFDDKYTNDRMLSSEEQPVYLKFNTEKQSCYVSDYSGQYRGVLITVFADYNDKILGTYGHFPLDLFN